MHYFKKVCASIKLFLNSIILFITIYRRGIYPSNSENLTTKEIFYFLVYITRNEYEKYSYIYLIFYIYAFFKKILFSILSIKDYHIPSLYVFIANPTRVSIYSLALPSLSVWGLCRFPALHRIFFNKDFLQALETV